MFVWEDLRAWATPLLSLAALVISWISPRSRARQDLFERLKDKVEKIDARLSHVEVEIEHLPDKDVAHRLEMAIARLDGRMETLDERLKPVAAMAGRLHEMALEEARHGRG
ncbi:DUF2730 family protein [Segnochrobactrum spirostomi]|uniref:DUF2730 family protein n=1 Tax=Segnochrobactrum spirostomi TaxID=2608987 RepID=A0A6A7Y4J2_9HYPH|nr:DUF2730 family protein [Segnochrobactrum spirostomi]MQT13656.1 DUF2730 family protein [Segnochrobactrum spirostomi]